MSANIAKYHIILLLVIIGYLGFLPIHAGVKVIRH